MTEDFNSKEILKEDGSPVGSVHISSIDNQETLAMNTTTQSIRKTQNAT